MTRLSYFQLRRPYSWGDIGEFGIKLGPGITIGRNDPQFLGIFGLYHGWRY